MTHLTTGVRLRIIRRKIGYGWQSLPGWMQDGVIAWLIALPLWLLLAMTLLVF